MDRRFLFLFLIFLGVLVSPHLSIQIKASEPFQTKSSLPRASNDIYILYPNGGEVLSGNTTIHWISPVSYLGMSIFYSIYYSPDNGLNWIQLAFYADSTSFIWNTGLYEKYLSKCFIKVVAQCKEWENDKQDISDGHFRINNRFKLPRVMTIAGISTPLLFVGITSLFLYQRKKKQKLTVGVLESSDIDFLRSVRERIVIGLDNIKHNFLEEYFELPRLEAPPQVTTIVEYFPDDMRYELKSQIKGRTVLVLVEIAYQNPSETNPANLASSLNIPRSTLSKELKRLVELEYVQLHISDQVVQDGRYKSFRVTQKGFSFLSLLSEALRVAIIRHKEQ